MKIFFSICGYGFSLYIAGYDCAMGERIILSWSLLKRHEVWRGENHTRSHSQYTYRCIKDGKTVESISFRSPIVSHI